MAGKRPFRNRLNDLSPKEWVKFQKSWFIHRSPPRAPEVMRHPAKFPETLAQQFVEFFTKRHQTVLDPMAGTGSTLIGCLRSGRHSIGIELNRVYADLARRLISQERKALGETASDLRAQVITGDAGRIGDFDLPVIDYVLTSPPYWDMLHARGAQTQRRRRRSPQLDITYSEDPADLGNISDYGTFLDRLVEIYIALMPVLRSKAYMTIIVKNIKKGGRIYPLAWDLAKRLGQHYALKDERIWCQDDVRLAPYGIGNAWVSNTVHHYCLQFRYEPVV